MEIHFEFLKVVVLLCLDFFKIVVEITSAEAKGVELSIGLEEKCGGCLLVGNTWITSFPLSHHVNAVWVPGEGEGIATVGGAKVYCSNHKVLVCRGGAARVCATICQPLQSDVHWGVAAGGGKLVHGTVRRRMNLVQVAVVVVVTVLLVSHHLVACGETNR